MNTGKPRDLLFSNISTAESISMFLFKGDFRSVATTLWLGPPSPFQTLLWVIHMGFGEPMQSKGKEKGHIKKQETRIFITEGSVYMFPFCHV